MPEPGLLNRSKTRDSHFYQVRGQTDLTTTDFAFMRCLKMKEFSPLCVYSTSELDNSEIKKKKKNFLWDGEVWKILSYDIEVYSPNGRVANDGNSYIPSALDIYFLSYKYNDYFDLGLVILTFRFLNLQYQQLITT